MRSILALAILLMGLKAAASEAQSQDALPAAEHVSLSSSTGQPDINNADREYVLTTPTVEPVEHDSLDAAHDQSETVDEPPQGPAPATTAAESEADADTADSLDTLCNALLTSAQDNKLPVPFFANLIWQESRLQRDSVSRAGALGIAQFMPDVALEVGLADPFDPRQAIPASARFLHTLRDHFGNLGFVAAAYNAGSHRVGEWLDHGRALPQETRIYVQRVTGRSAEAWRKSSVDDSKLTFTRELPCRGLPAFAELEAAQLRDQAEAQDDDKQQEDAAAANVIDKVARKAGLRFAKHIGQKAERRLIAARASIAAPKNAGKELLHLVADGAAAKPVHVAARREPGRAQHLTHERRRIANAI